MNDTTRRADDVMIALTLPRAAREILARLTDRLAHKGNGMSQHAIEAVQVLLAPSDRVELTYMQAVAVSSQSYAESARIELARSQDKMTARQELADQAIMWAMEQARPQMLATPVEVDGVFIQSKAPGPGELLTDRISRVGQVRTGMPGAHRKPEKLGIFPTN